ncbi:unnamed protein product [Symbiodinium sp. CCMP2592]|nr:unnamed protein product [Symbiodinium sp. CCMP2592]
MHCLSVCPQAGGVLACWADHTHQSRPWHLLAFLHCAALVPERFTLAHDNSDRLFGSSTALGGESTLLPPSRRPSPRRMGRSGKAKRNKGRPGRWSRGLATEPEEGLRLGSRRRSCSHSRSRSRPRPSRGSSVPDTGSASSRPPATKPPTSGETSFKRLLLAPRRLVRLFQATPDYPAGLPGIIVPDSYPGTDLDPAVALTPGQSSCKVVFTTGDRVCTCASTQILPSTEADFPKGTVGRLQQLYRWVVHPPPRTRYAKPPQIQAPGTAISTDPDDELTTGPPAPAVIQLDSENDEEDVQLLVPPRPRSKPMPQPKRYPLTPPSTMPVAPKTVIPDEPEQTEPTDGPPEAGSSTPEPAGPMAARTEPMDLVIEDIHQTVGELVPAGRAPEPMDTELGNPDAAAAKDTDPAGTLQPLPSSQHADGPTRHKRRKRQLRRLVEEAMARRSSSSHSGARDDPGKPRGSASPRPIPGCSPFSPRRSHGTSGTETPVPLGAPPSPLKQPPTADKRRQHCQSHHTVLADQPGIQEGVCLADPIATLLALLGCHAALYSALTLAIVEVGTQSTPCPFQACQPQLHILFELSQHHFFLTMGTIVRKRPSGRLAATGTATGSQRPKTLHKVASKKKPAHSRAKPAARASKPKSGLKQAPPSRSSYAPTTPSWWASDPEEPHEPHASDSDQIDKEMEARGDPPPPVQPLRAGDPPRGPPPPQPVRYDVDTHVVTVPPSTGPALFLSLSRFSWPASRLLLLGVSSILQAPSDAHATGIKRAYNRAVRRAQASPLQGTFYRGRWCSFRAPVISPQPRTDRRPQLHAAAPASAARLLHVSYNAGGLTGESYQELMQWLAQLPPEQCPMIVHIQETHWSHDQEYSTPGWHIISSACPSPKAGGLLTLVSTQLCSANQISSSSRVAGRLLHVRIDLGDRTVDAINTYQKVYHSGSTRIEKGQTQIAADQRRDVWTSLRGLLKEIPIRHHLILSGDFNSPAPLIPELVGSKARAFRTPMVPDLAALEALLVDFQLLHLNSWTRRAGPTFISPQGASQIDHVFVRKATADMPARGGSPCNWPLAAWRQGGRHRPVQVSLPIRPYRALGKSQPKRALLDLQGLRNACRDPSHPGIRQLRASVEALLSDSPEATVEEVNSHVLQQATAVFPAVRNQGRVVPWQSPTVELSVKGMWQAYHCWRHGPTTGRRNVFALWRAYSAFRRAHKQFRQRTREAKRAWFHDQILGMERASAAGDVRALFRLAGALLPKQPRRKVQLRGPNGELWSSTQQVDCLKTFFQDLYAPEDEPTLPPLPPLQAPTISSSEAHHRLARLPVHKATPAHQAPTAAVVACADLLAPWLSDKVGSLSSFPAVWSDCWLA